MKKNNKEMELLATTNRTSLKECECGCRLFYTKSYQALYKDNSPVIGIYETEYICKECNRVIYKQTFN